MVDDTGLRRPLPAELTGEMPTFVRDLVDAAVVPEGDSAEPAPETDEDTVAALRELGIGEDVARDAVRRGRVPLALIEHEWEEKTRYDLDELVRKSDLRAEFVRDLYVAMGLPVPSGFSREDVKWARNIRRMLDVLPREAIIRSARARGMAMATIARSDMGLVRDEVILPLRQAGADDLTIGVALKEAAESLDDISRDVLDWLYETHLRAMISSEMASLAVRTTVDEVDIAVGFVDVVGYTALSARVDSAGLDELLEVFETHVVEVVSDAPHVGVVKYLGDAAMLVAPDPVALGEVMLELTRPLDVLDDAPLRGGMAYGPTIVRDGDYFGAAVNLAARLTDLARPWSVLADESLQDRLGSISARRLRAMRVRGLGVQRPLVLGGDR